MPMLSYSAHKNMSNTMDDLARVQLKSAFGRLVFINTAPDLACLTFTLRLIQCRRDFIVGIWKGVLSDNEASIWLLDLDQFFNYYLTYWSREHDLRQSWHLKSCTSIICNSLLTLIIIMTSSNGNIFGVTGQLCGEFTGHRWIPLTKASDADFWRFLSAEPE